MEAPQRAVYPSVSVEDLNGNELNYSSESSDSPRASNSLDHGSKNSSVDMNMVENCSIMTSAKNLNRKLIVQSENIETVDCLATLNNDSNQNVTLMISGLQNCSVYSGSVTCCVHGVMVNKKCLDSKADKAFDIGLTSKTVPSSCRLSDICSSVSSDEMLIRSNSFIIHEPDELLSTSVLEQSSDKLSDLGMMPGMLPDVCEGLVNNIKISEEATKLGVTFIQPSNQTFIMEDEVFHTISSSGGLYKGCGESRYLDFVSVDRSDCITPVCQKKFNTEAQNSANSTPGEAKTFNIPAEELDLSGNVQTSTPVQSLSSKPCLPSLSDSSLKQKTDLGSPITDVMKKSASQKPKTPLTAPAKSNKIQTKRFIKPDFTNMKSKILSRPLGTSKSSTEVKASTNLVRKPSPSTEHKSSLASSTKPEMTSNPKRVQNASIKTPSTCQDGSQTVKSKHHTWSEASISSKTTAEESCVKEQPITKSSDNRTTPKTPSLAGLRSRFGLVKQDKEEKQGKGFNMWKKSQKSNPMVSKNIYKPLLLIIIIDRARIIAFILFIKTICGTL